ncbi:MAG: Ig-like domain repeat protein, partial [Actinobacteria bacterium]|nr:Ig-like domain repeat protein [Actinomycetota bacterium]
VAFTTAKLAPGSYPYVLSYEGNDQVLGFEKTGTLTVKKATVGLKAVAKVKPTTLKAGSYAVTVSSPKGLSHATGKVTLTLSKGAKKQTVTVSLKSGTAKVKVKKLTAGKWKVAVAYSGDTKYASAKAKATTLTVK